MENNNLDFEKLYRLISKYNENGQWIGDIDSLEYAQIVTVEESSEENKTIKEYLDSEMGSPEEVETKKLMALASVMSGDDRSAMEIAADIDEGVTFTKVAYKVGTGELDTLEAFDILVDKAAARLKAFVDVVLEPERASEVVSKTIVSVFPRARFAQPYIKEVVRRSAPVVRQAINYGIDKVADKAKSVVRSSVEWIKDKVKVFS